MCGATGCDCETTTPNPPGAQAEFQSPAVPAPPESSPDAPQPTAVEQARAARIPDWWLPDPQTEGLAGVPIEEALARLLRTACHHRFRVRLPESAMKVKGGGADPLVHLSVPWNSAKKAFTEAGLEFDVAAVAQQCTDWVQQRAAAWLAVSVHSDNGRHQTRFTVSEALRGHELIRQNCQPTMDPVIRRNKLR